MMSLGLQLEPQIASEAAAGSLRIGVIGISHKLADLSLRERLAGMFQSYFTTKSCPALNISYVLISTCNRTELYFSSEHPQAIYRFVCDLISRHFSQEIDSKLYAHFGHDCFLHLARVVTGLDSAIVAETEIRGQAKQAYKTAHAARTLRKDIHFLFQKCFKISKQVRTALSMERGTPDIDRAIFKSAKNLWQNLEACRVLFVGASDINVRILRTFRSKQVQSITLCNRTQHRAEIIAKQENIHTLHWDQIHLWHEFDLIVVATKCPRYILEVEHNRSNQSNQSNHNKLIVDLSVPRNADPALKQLSDVTLLNIDDIGQLVQKDIVQNDYRLACAEEIIKNNVTKQIKIYKARHLRSIENADNQ